MKQILVEKETQIGNVILKKGDKIQVVQEQGKMNEAIIPYYSILLSLNYSNMGTEIFKAKSQEDANKIISFLSSCDYVWGNTIQKPKLTSEFKY
jgi:hypothetical protein